MLCQLFSVLFLYLSEHLLLVIQAGPLQLVGCRVLLQEVSHEELGTLLLPVVHKALLRTPEIVLISLEHLAKGLSIDPSQYLGDLAKLLQGKLL